MSFFGFGARANTPNKLGAIQVQTSERGVPYPYAAGTVKLPLKLIDYTDFTAVASKSSGGGKGGGSGVDSYDYFAAIDAALCCGPIDGPGNIYDSGGGSGLQLEQEIYVVPSGGGTFTSGSSYTENDEGCSYLAPYSYTANDYGSDGSRLFSGTQQKPMQKLPPGSNLGAGQYSVVQDNNVTSTSSGSATGSGGNLHYTFSSADAGKTITISYTITTNQTNYVSPAAKYNLAFAPGVMAGTAWGYMLAKHPERALSYPGIARVLAQNLGLGSSATPPNISVEVLNARGLAFGSGIADCDPAAIIRDLCSDPIHGMAWPYVGDLTDYSNFCVANNLFQSIAVDSQRKALEVIKEVCDLSNSEVVYSSGMLKVVPYGDATAVANGRTYTPTTTPVYALDLSDFAGDAANPIKTTWPGLADNFNSLSFQYTRRDDNYNTDILPLKDEASISMYGLLPAKTLSGDNYRVKNYAAVAADMLLKRNSVALRQYSFRLKWWYQLLEPMDIVLLNTKGGRAVRIISVSENDDYTIDVTAEDFRFGVGTGVLYPKGDPGGNQPSAHAQPGNTRLLAAFQPNTRLTGGANELWLALTGGANWGGCRAYLSKDGVTYTSTPIFTQYGSSRAGSVSAPIAAAPDPDTSNYLSVSVTGSLATVSKSDADAFSTICLVGSELMSYETAVLTGSSVGQNNYKLYYLRRGIFANNSQAHDVGEIFVRLDNQVAKYALDPSLLTSRLYIKLLSFNLYGNEQQGLSDVSPIVIQLGGIQVASNMAVGAYLNSGGTDATVSVYLIGGAAGASGTATLSNGATVTLPAKTWASQPLDTWFGVNFNPSTNDYVLYTDPNLWYADQSTMLGIGSVRTPKSGASSSSPTYYNDAGSVQTYNPAGAYTSGQTATVSSFANWS